MFSRVEGTDLIQIPVLLHFQSSRESLGSCDRSQTCNDYYVLDNERASPSAPDIAPRSRSVLDPTIDMIQLVVFWRNVAGAPRAMSVVVHVR
jgi:hypothetical protein